MVLAGTRCRSGRVGSGRIDVSLRGVRVQTLMVLLGGAPCAGLNSGKGMRWAIGQEARGVTAAQAEPCRIMAHVSGQVALFAAERGAGTSGRRPR